MATRCVTIAGDVATPHMRLVQAPCGWIGGGVISSCVLLVVTVLIIVLASKQFGFADFRFTGSFQQVHPLPPGSLQHQVCGFICVRSSFVWGQRRAFWCLPRGKFGVDCLSCFPGRVQVDWNCSAKKCSFGWVRHFYTQNSREC